MHRSTESKTVARPVVVPCGNCAKLSRVDLGRLEDKPKCRHCNTPFRLAEPIPATDADLPRIIREATVPVVVDFYADWCAPCRMMAPAFADLARRHAGDALVVKLDTEANHASASAHGIRGLPTVVVFEGGREARRQVGAVPLQGLEQLLAGSP